MKHIEKWAHTMIGLRVEDVPMEAVIDLHGYLNILAAAILKDEQEIASARNSRAEPAPVEEDMPQIVGEIDPKSGGVVWAECVGVAGDDFPEEAYQEFMRGRPRTGAEFDLAHWVWARDSAIRRGLKKANDILNADLVNRKAERDAALGRLGEVYKYRNDWWELAGYLFPEGVKESGTHTLEEMQAGIRVILDERGALKAENEKLKASGK